MGATRKCSQSPANNRKYCCSCNSFGDDNHLLTALLNCSHSSFLIFFFPFYFSILNKDGRCMEMAAVRGSGIFFFFVMFHWQPFHVTWFNVFSDTLCCVCVGCSLLPWKGHGKGPAMHMHWIIQSFYIS